MRIHLLFVVMIFTLLFGRRDCLHHSTKDALGRYERPEKDTLAISPSEHFYIHFDTTGSAAPDLTDSDDNGVPDYIDEVGTIADSAHHVLVNILGYSEEPFDGEGGYDIYIMNYGSGVYGYNMSESNGTSFMKIDNDYSNFDSKFNLSPIDIMRITVGHEYFHGIQWGYEETIGGNKYFYEMTSMWFEDVLIPDGNDYLDGWADPLLNNPTADFDKTGDGYELALFGHYLSSFIDVNGREDAKESTIIREIWERYSQFSHDKAFSAVKYVLSENYNITFIEAWVDFISRNLYNGLYDGIENPYYYYIDQALIDPIKTSAILLTDTSQFELRLDNESCDIKSFRIGSTSSMVTITHGKENYLGRLGIVSNTDQSNNDLFWSVNTTTSAPQSNVKINFIYGVDDSSLALPIEVVVQTVPYSPSELFVQARQDSIFLFWKSSPGPGENLQYIIYRDGDSIWVTPDTSHVDNLNITGSKLYSYAIGCRNSVGESPFSETVYIQSWPDEENVVSSAIISIYPNPVKRHGTLNLVYALDGEYPNTVVKLYNILGQLIHSETLISVNQGWHRGILQSIINDNLSAGVYLVQLQTNSGVVTNQQITILP